MSSFSFSFDSPTNPWVIPHALNDEHVFWVIYNDSGEGIGSSGCVLRGTSDKGRSVNALPGPAAGVPLFAVLGRGAASRLRRPHGIVG